MEPQQLAMTLAYVGIALSVLCVLVFFFSGFGCQKGNIGPAGPEGTEGFVGDRGTPGQVGFATSTIAYVNLANVDFKLEPGFPGSIIRSQNSVGVAKFTVSMLGGTVDLEFSLNWNDGGKFSWSGASVDATNRQERTFSVFFWRVGDTEILIGFPGQTSTINVSVPDIDSQTITVGCKCTSNNTASLKSASLTVFTDTQTKDTWCF